MQNNAPRWYITGQQPTTMPNAQGQFVAGVKVLFATDFGVADSVFIPNTLYSVDYARDAINERYADLIAVHSLQG